MLNGRFILEEEYRERKAALDQKYGKVLPWSKIIKMGIKIYENKKICKKSKETDDTGRA